MITSPPQYGWMPVAKDDVKDGDEVDIDIIGRVIARRRRITPPKGYRIKAINEPVRGQTKVTQDGITWTDWTTSIDAPSTVKQWCEYNNNILAIAEPLKQDADSDQAAVHGMGHYAEPISTEKKGGNEKCSQHTTLETSPAPEVTKGASIIAKEGTINLMSASEAGRKSAENLLKAMNPKPVAPGPTLESAMKKLMQPPPWQRISETCLPKDNEPFFAWSANQKTMFTYTNGINYPTSLIQSNFTHFLPCTGIYQIPPPPVEETKPAWEVWFELDTKEAAFSKHDKLLAKSIVLAALRAAKANPTLLDNL